MLFMAFSCEAYHRAITMNTNTSHITQRCGYSVYSCNYQATAEALLNRNKQIITATIKETKQQNKKSDTQNYELIENR